MTYIKHKNRILSTTRRAVRKREPKGSFGEGSKDSDFEQSEAEEGKELSDLQLENADMGGNFMFYIAKHAFNEGPFVIQFRIICIGFGKQAQRTPYPFPPSFLETL